MAKFRIALWGLENTEKLILRSCPDTIEVPYFVTANTDYQGRNYKGTEIISPEKLKEAWDGGEIEAVFIYTYTKYAIAPIIEELKYMGIHRIGVFRRRVGLGQKIDWESVIYLDELDKPFLPYVQTNLINACNLNCKGCSHFANLFQGEGEADIEEFRRDLAQLQSHSFVSELRLMGGEPLMAAHKEDFIRAARQIMPDTDIRLVTNGTLLLRQDESFFDCLIENDVVLDISAYQPTLEYKDGIIRLLEDKKIPYLMTLNIGKFYRTVNIRGDSDYVKAHEICLQSFCCHLKAGMLYMCPMEAFFERYLEYFAVPHEGLHTERFGIDIYDEGLNWERLPARLTRPKPLCAWCTEKGDEFFDWAVAADPAKEDWIVKGI